MVIFGIRFQLNFNSTSTIFGNFILFDNNVRLHLERPIILFEVNHKQF